MSKKLRNRDLDLNSPEGREFFKKNAREAALSLINLVGSLRKKWLEQRLLERQEEALQTNSRALEQFAMAMKECAEQLAGHTAAVEGIAAAAQELRDTVREMNRALGHVNADRGREAKRS